jgi:hypothetical protein
MLDSEFEKLNKDGFVLVKNFLKISQIEQIKNIIKKQPMGKGVKESHYSANLTSLTIKFLKLDFRKFFYSLYFLKLQDKLKIKNIANRFFNKQSKLVQIDGYYNLIQKSDILPWHSDQAYSGAQTIGRIASPDYFFLKFFFYLTKVGPNNGCTSYIPRSHKITHAVRACLYEKKIKYEPFWQISDLVNLISKKNNYTLVVDKVGSKMEVDNFLNTAN